MFKVLKDAWPYSDLQTWTMRCHWVLRLYIRCMTLLWPSNPDYGLFHWVLRLLYPFPVDPVCDMFTVSPFSPQTRLGAPASIISKKFDINLRGEGVGTLSISFIDVISERVKCSLLAAGQIVMFSYFDIILWGLDISCLWHWYFFHSTWYVSHALISYVIGQVIMKSKFESFVNNLFPYYSFQ